jgi:mRNA-degrading endonuclease toxin of MazEF toxin-antitoxin module
MIENILKLLDKWHIKKKQNVKHSKSLNFKERDIFFLSIGENIGYEQNGKGDEFLRPVIIYKKFNNNQFLAIPLTSKEKSSKYYFEFQYKKDIKSYAILSQIRVFDAKRLKYKSGYINKDDFKKLIKKTTLIVTPQEEESPEGICKNIISKNSGDVK